MRQTFNLVDPSLVICLSVVHRFLVELCGHDSAFVSVFLENSDRAFGCEIHIDLLQSTHSVESALHQPPEISVLIITRITLECYVSSA